MSGSDGGITVLCVMEMREMYIPVIFSGDICTQLPYNIDEECVIVLNTYNVGVIFVKIKSDNNNNYFTVKSHRKSTEK